MLTDYVKMEQMKNANMYTKDQKVPVSKIHNFSLGKLRKKRIEIEYPKANREPEPESKEMAVRRLLDFWPCRHK